MSQGNLINQFKLSLAAFWSARNARERGFLTLAAAIIIVSLAYILFISPALTARALLFKQLPELRGQVVLMQTLSNEALTYAKKDSSPAATISQQLISATLAQQGLTSSSISFSGDLIQIQLNNASFTALTNWLNTLQNSTHAYVTEATLVALTQPDMVTAKVTLQLRRDQ